MPMQSFNYQHRPAAFVRPAFTLVEMLVAMAVTLLMMAALARAFGFVGERVRDSRANLQITSEMRDVTMRLNDELSRCTVNLQPNTGGADQAGYFLYVEGPVTDATSSLFRATTDADGDVDLPDSRYGDFDDYLAFTAIAPPNTWFVGKVPRFILDRKTAETLNNDNNPGNDVVYPTDFATDQFTPVVIKSRYAEIVYFASPEYNLRLGSGDAGYDDYVDLDGEFDLNGDGVATNNGLPDRLKLYRRVLLIRPDLNLAATGALPQESDGSVTFMQTDAHPTNWAVAMAAAHQQCDLSLRRVLGANGLPSQSVAANSLADLASPHNRFAHVRIPNGDLGVGGGADTSMPVVSLGRPATILNMPNAGGGRIAPDPSPASPTANTDSVVTTADWCGFLRREFVLGHDAVHPQPDPTGPWSLIARLGEDLVVNNAHWRLTCKFMTRPPIGLPMWDPV